MFILDTCGGIYPVVSIIKKGIIPLIEIIIPIVLIVLGMLDLGKAVIASKEDEIKAAQKLLIKRIIYAVAIFLVVFIVTVIFNMLSNNAISIGEDNQTWQYCWNCEGVDKDGKCIPG